MDSPGASSRSRCGEPVLVRGTIRLGVRSRAVVTMASALAVLSSTLLSRMTAPKANSAMA